MNEPENNPWREAADRGFSEPPHQDEAPAPRGRSGWGCLMWGCLTVVVLFLVGLIVAVVSGYYFLKGQLEQYTDAEPVVLPVVEMDEQELQELTGRVEAFREGIGLADRPGAEEAPEEGAPRVAPGELVLTADQLNALIAEDPELRGRFHVRIEEGLLTGDVSMPTDLLPMGMGKGRFFNATVTFDVSIERGRADVRVVDASVKGAPLPAPFLQALRNENLAKSARDEPEAAALLDRIESLRIDGDRLILRARAEEDAP